MYLPDVNAGNAGCEQDEVYCKCSKAINKADFYFDKKIAI